MIEVATTPYFTYLSCKVKPSMKQICYKVLLKFNNETSDVYAAMCTCPAGTGVNCLGKCNHIGSILFAMEDFNRKGLKEFNEPLTFTSKLSKWNAPRDSSSAPAPIDQVLIKTTKFGDKTETEIIPKVNSYDSRAPHQREVDPDGLEVLKQKLQSCLSHSSFFLCHDITSKCIQGEPQTITCEEITWSEMDDVSEIDINENEKSLSFNEFFDISSNLFKEIVDFYVDSQTVSNSEVSEIEKCTRGQTSSQHWWDHRKERLTASKFYTVAVNTVEPSKILIRFFTAN